MSSALNAISHPASHLQSGHQGLDVVGSEICFQLVDAGVQVVRLKN